MATIQLQHDEMAEVRSRLMAWGEWLRATSICNLNYPCKSTFVVTPGGRDADYDNPEAEEIERIMLDIKNRHPMIYAALLQDYYYQSTNRDAAKRLQISEATYKSRRMVGEHMVSIRLEGF